MAVQQDGLPTTSLLLLATALLLFGGGLVGYVAGEQQGEQRSGAIVRAVGAQWDLHRDAAGDRFDAAIGEAAAMLEKAVGDLRAQVPMYHGCGAICHSIAYQFGEEVLRVRDAIKTIEPAPIAHWTDVLRASGIPINHSAAPIEPNDLRPRLAVPALVALLCATVVLCFGIACFTLLKLRGAPPGRA